MGARPQIINAMRSQAMMPFVDPLTGKLIVLDGKPVMAPVDPLQTVKDNVMAYRIISRRAALGSSEPLPRHPWDPRAVSDPRLVADEFPNLRRAEREVANQPGGSR